MITIDDLNIGHATQFAALGSYEGGESGAVRLVDDNGRRFVLKHQPPGLAPTTTDVLRALGYPAPRYVVWDADYHVQEELPGRPAGDWGVASPAVMDRLVELNEFQAKRSVDRGTSWRDDIVGSVLQGFSDYAVVATLDRHSDASRELLRLCRRAAEGHAAAVPEAQDIVHWDYSLSNILVDGDRVTGVIDWGGTRTGDRLFDLVTLLYYARGDAPELERYVIDRIGRDGLSVYLAHLAIRQTDWSLRRHGRAAGEQVLGYSLRLARSFPQ